MTRWPGFGTSASILIALVLILSLLPHAPQVMAQSDVEFAIPSEKELGESLTLPDNDPVTPDDLPTLEDVRDEHAEQANLLPESEWDIPALADALDYDPERAFAFVRDRIGFDPYAGVLRGAEGTLAARAGNAWDRALLLSELLTAMAVPARFALGELDQETAAALVSRAALTPAFPLATPGIEIAATVDQAAVERRARRDYARLRAVLGDRIEAIPAADTEALAMAVRDHTWVQAALGPDWLDLDPTMPDAVPGETVTTQTEVVLEPPEEVVQHVALKVVAGMLTGDGLVEQVVLEQRWPAWDAAGRQLFLFFLPFDEKLGGAIAESLLGDESWVAALMADGEIQTGTPFRSGGRGTDVFGEAMESAELATLRIEVALAAGRPGTGPSARRILLDRLPANADEPITLAPQALPPLPGDTAGPFALAQIHHVMVSTGGADRRDFAIQRSEAADFVGTAMASALPPEAYALDGLLWPVATADQALVIASEAGAVPASGSDAHRAFVGHPRVYLSTFGRDGHDGSLAFATDLLIDGVQLLPTRATDTSGPGSIAKWQLWYGALQTALETELALRRAALLDPAARSVSGASLAAGPLTLIEPALADTLPSGTPGVLRAALLDGSYILLSEAPDAATTWWTVSAETGETRSILAPGLGGAVPRGVPARSASVTNASYTHGAGARLAPRQGAIRPPAGGGRFVSTRPVPGACGPSDDLGYVPLIGCVSVQAALGFALVAIEVAWFATLAYYVAG